MDKLLTVSVAAYNMESFITETLDSLMDESVLEELEIFVVDDGGTDGTMDIAERYAQRYPGSVFPIRKDNGGYGTTVNYSLAHAAGRFFRLLDGDDWFDRDGLRALMEALRDTDADVVITPYYKGQPESRMDRVFSFAGRGEGDLPAGCLDSGSIFGMWSLTYKTELLRQSGLELPGGMLYTDQLFATVPFALVRTVRFVDRPLYCYRTGREGQSVSRDSRIRHCQDALDHCERLCRFYEAQKVAGCQAVGYLRRRVAAYHVMAVRTLLLFPPTADNMARLRAYDKKIMELSRDVYDAAGRLGKMGLLLRALRWSDFRLCRLISLIPGGMPDWA